ncbi:MAG: hypothetical protein EOP86_12180 [Verrucomicrobiaceae bacterium]|nr:MAG: hypothetical protein EOP86_12180 [Verrucomicrobiaceae bacterium]
MNASPTLRQWLTAQGGAVPFRQYMEAALHDPEFGYYSRGISTVGRGGDFSTSASLSGMLGRAIAAWAGEQRAALGPGLCHLIEIGPGTGQLHRDLLRAMGWRGRMGWRSHLVERSPKLRAMQRRTLGIAGWRAHWHDNPASALQAAGGRALIFSNELVDAFPVTLLQRDDGAWREVWLELLPDGRLVETLRPAERNSLPASLKPDAFPEGQRVEAHDSHRQWLRGWLPHWKSGTMLTIDYGSEAETLYYRRPHGTLRGYHRHERLEGLRIYRDPGQCDLTADVNFTDLQKWGVADGLRTVSLESQSRFLTRHAKVRNSADAWLADEAGPGGAFLCLQQRPAAG